MPNYEFTNEQNGETETHHVKISELDEFKTNNPHLKQKLSTPAFGDAYRMGKTKHPESWNQLLKNVKKRYHGSTIETK